MRLSYLILYNNDYLLFGLYRMSVSKPTSSATEIKELNDFYIGTFKIYKPKIINNHEAFIDKIISKLDSKKITIIDLNYKRKKSGISKITKIPKIIMDRSGKQVNVLFIKYSYLDDKEYVIDLSIFLSKLYLNDTQTQIYFDLDKNTTFDILLKQKTTESLDISHYLEERRRIYLPMPVFKKQTLRGSRLDYIKLASLRKDYLDEKFIKHKLLFFKKSNDYTSYLTHINELMMIEIEIAKNNLKIKKNIFLQQNLLRGTITTYRKGKGVKVEISQIRKLPLSNKDIKISASLQNGYDISIKLTDEEIQNIEKDIKEKYERIKNEIDKELMPPPNFSYQ